MIARAGVLALLMALTSLSAAMIAPAPAPLRPAPDLEALTPDAFGAWRRIAMTDAVLPAETALGDGEAVLYRAYEDAAGRIVTLVVAYGPPLGDSVRLHRPEACYVAQGFEILDRRVDGLTAGSTPIRLVRLSTENALRKEAVTYWLRAGDAFTVNAPHHQLLAFGRGLDGPAEGALVRVSSPGANADALHDEFLAAFAEALTPSAREVFLGRSA